MLDDMMSLNPIEDPYNSANDPKQRTFYELPLNTRLTIWTSSLQDASLIGTYYHALASLEDQQLNRFGDEGMPIIEYISLAYNAMTAAERQHLTGYAASRRFAGEKNGQIDFSTEAIRQSLKQGLGATVGKIIYTLDSLNRSEEYLRAISDFSNEFMLMQNLCEYIQASVFDCGIDRMKEIAADPACTNIFRWNGELKDFLGDISEDALTEYHSRAIPVLKASYAGLLQQISDAEKSEVFPIYFEGNTATAIWARRSNNLTAPLVSFYDSLGLYQNRELGMGFKEFIDAVHSVKAYDRYKLRW